MSPARDFEPVIRAWLDEGGPQDVPDRVVERAISQARLTRRVRGWPRLLEGIPGWPSRALPEPAPLRRAWLLAGILLAAVLGAGLVGVGARLIQPDASTRTGLVAFDAGGDIWTARPDGSELRTIAASGELEANPRWALDGRLLAYTVTHADQSVIVRIVMPDGSGARDFEAPEGAVIRPHAGIIGWSPDGRRFAVPGSKTAVDGALMTALSNVILVFDLESGEAGMIDPGFEATGFGWSPDGRLMGILAAPGPETLDAGLLTQGQIHIMEASGANARQLTDDPIAYQYPRGPVFTPDGTSVVYYREAPGRFDGDIYSVKVDGTDARAVLSGPTNDIAPAISPSGRFMAFSRSTNAGIATAVTRILAWNPKKDGSSDLGRSDSADLFVASSSGHRARRVAAGLWPGTTWSPDERALAALSMDWLDLVLVRLDGGPQVRIASPEGAEIGGFSWQPRPP